MMKWLKKIIHRLFKTRLTTAQFHLLREIYRRRSCKYCSFLIPCNGGWECRNKLACEMRGMSIPGVCHCPYPGVCHCPYWKPDRKFIGRKLSWERMKKLFTKNDLDRAIRNLRRDRKLSGKEKKEKNGH